MRRHDRLRNRTVVITGASAGVGRAAARAFARLGANVGLIARESQGLEEAAAEVNAVGGRALACAADVADAESVFKAAEACEARFGAIDVWVNNAMVTVFSPVWKMSPDEVRRVTEVTYLGYAHGTMAALRSMRRRNRGVIVQVGSSLAYRGIPLQSAYCAAKHAIRGFTDSLRTELLHEGSGIAVTMVHLPAVNTPHFDWARAHIRRQPRPIAPVYQPTVAARAIVRAASDPRREYWLGGRTPLIILGNMIAPRQLDRLLAHTAFEGQQTKRPVTAGRHDNLYDSVGGLHRTGGSFASSARSNALSITGQLARTAALAAGVFLAGAAAVGARELLQAPRKKV